MSKWLRFYGIPRRGRGRDQNAYPTRDEILTRWTPEFTEAGIATTFGISLGTLHRLREKYGLPPKPKPDNSGPRNGHWNGGYAEYYGPNWERQRKLALERDHCACRRCGLTMDETGKEPDVHHLRRFKGFNGDYERANALPNLVSLCAACHQFAEHNPLIPLPAQPDPTLRPGTIPRKSGYIQPTIVDPAEVVGRYDAGEPVQTTCDALGISTITYYRSLRRAGRKGEPQEPGGSCRSRSADS